MISAGGGLLPLLVFEMARGLQTAVAPPASVVPLSNTVRSGLDAKCRPPRARNASALASVTATPRPVSLGYNTRNETNRIPVRAESVYEFEGVRWRCHGRWPPRNRRGERERGAAGTAASPPRATAASVWAATAVRCDRPATAA